MNQHSQTSNHETLHRMALGRPTAKVVQPSSLVDDKIDLEYPTSNTETTFDVMDCWTYENVAGNTSTVRSVGGSEIDAWLVAPVPSHDGQHPIGGLRLIIGRQISASTLPFTEIQLKNLSKNSILQSLFCGIMASSIGVTTRLCSEGSDSVFIFKEENMNGIASTILHFNSETNITTGYVIACAVTKVEEILAEIQSAFPACCHPLLVPAILYNASTQALSKRFANIHKELSLHEGHEHRDTSISDSFSRSLDLIGGLRRELAFAEDDLGNIKIATTFLQEQIRQLRPSSAEEKDKQKQQIATTCLNNRLETMLSTLAHLNSFKSLQRRLQSQHEFLTSLVALQNCLTSTSTWRCIEESPEPSSGGATDKLVAILTVLFIPSTFVATILTMPFFDWSAPSDLIIVKGRLWIYWAITIPLTTIILVVTMIWLRSRTKERMRMHEPAQLGKRD
ncbi:MAG: hypothetical protein M1813_006379 [Trichoglossum hirsutum]|nr:MAG: hypothetical protein M1813_006379 [Trichoglossum hirsutum]